MSTVVCITGMHRSGTSLTASWLERCGLPIHAGEVFGPGTGNLPGHFEDVDMTMFHQRILECRGLGPVGWGVTGKDFLPFEPDDRLRANELVRVRDDQFPVWAWKDPRTVLFLEAWEEVIAGLKVLLLWRPANVVVDSLGRRSRRSNNPDMKAKTWASVSLWSAYNRLVLNYRRRHPDTTVLLPVSRVIAADRPAFDLVQERLGLSLDYTPLADLYDPTQLASACSPARRAMLSAATRAQGCDRLERDLMELSDDPR